MFNNIGRKIKGLATFLTIVGIVASFITGFVIIGASKGQGPSVLIGLLVMALGSVLSWVSSFLLYGFGQLVESAQNIERELTGESGDYEDDDTPAAADPDFIPNVKEEPELDISSVESIPVVDSTPQAGSVGLILSNDVLTCVECGSIVEPGDSRCSGCKKTINWNNVIKK